jgi:hypothetical protein
LNTNLYKYQPVTARTLENLKLRTIWFSAPSAFNDPFDCSVDVLLKELDQDDLVRVYEYLRGLAELTPEFDAEITTNGKPNERCREMFNQIFSSGPLRQQIDETRRRIGVACFSTKNDDLLMWAHYADGHRGFCLEFDSSVEPFSKAKPVAYQASLPEVNPLDVLDGGSSGQELIEAMLRTKHTCWRYEQEWRLLHQQAGTAYAYPFDALTGVYLGASMPPGQKDMIGQLLHGAGVQLYEMKRGSGGFVVESSSVTYTPYQHPADDGDQAC